MKTEHELRHQKQKISNDADQTELQAYLNGVTRDAEGIRDDLIAGSIEREPGLADVEPWLANDIEIENLSGDILSELEKRAEILGDGYPFEIEGVSLRYVLRESCIYEFCLAASLSTNLTSGRYVEFPRLFEKISGHIVKLFFGDFANVVHVGSPREGGISFKEAWANISEDCGELFWRPDEGLSVDGPVSGDEGVDIVIWLSAGDNRTIGQLFALGQCACGQDAYSKYSDVSFKRVSQWFNPFTAFDAVRFFTLPYLLVDAKLLEASKQAHLTFDRARLVGVATSRYDQLPSNILEGMRDITEFYLRGIDS